MRKQKTKPEANNEMVKDNDNVALESLTKAMYEYEQTTGNRITNVVIDTNPVDESDCKCETCDYDDNFNYDGELGTVDVSDYNCEVCDQFADDPISKYDDEVYADEARKLINKCIADPIKRLFPVSTYNDEAERYESKYNNDHLRFVLADKRSHNKAIAAAVGQIAEATTAMLLEYQTQSISRAIGDGGVLQYESMDENGRKLFNPYEKDN